MRKLNAILLAIILLISFTFLSCGNNDKEIATVEDVEFWQTYSTEKVFQDVKDIYDNIKFPAQVNISAIRGEEEATQIIMTTGEKRIDSYDVEVTDLSSGDDVLSKDNITVYHQKYIEVGAASEYYSVRGMYPDCLVPFNNVKNVKENYIEANNNQGLYISIDIPQTQPEGVYVGNLKITIGDTCKNIPINIDVKGGYITDETNFLSCFLVKWRMAEGELDYTNEMLDKYNRMLFDYRLGACDLLYRNGNTDREIQLYAEYACDYSKLPECGGWCIPVNYISMKNYSYAGELITSTKNQIDPQMLCKYILTVAREGFKQNVNPFKKAYVYGRDEPDLNGVGGEIVKIDGFMVHHAKEQAVSILENEVSSLNLELWKEMKSDIMGIPHVVTSSSFMDVDFDLNEVAMTYCPEFQFIETEELRDKYRLSTENDLWWYGCCNPDYPYPTYHIDDTLISARLLSWMQADYNIQGNLYWATDLYSQGGVDLEDYYTGSAIRSVGTNGEGFLFYPGKKYGVDGPLPSVRLEQIRDGLEEAEMILAIRKIYNKISEEIDVEFSEDAFMNYIYGTMYTGTRVSTTNEVFAQNREYLLNLLCLAQSNAEVCITSVKENVSGYEFKVYVNNGYVLKYNGQEATNKTSVGNGNMYTVNVDLTKAQTFNISVDVDGKTYGLDMSFGSSIDMLSAEDLYDNDIVEERSVTISQELVDATSVNSSDTENEKYLKLSFDKAEASKEHDFIIGNELVKKLNKNTDKFVIQIYNSSKEEITIKVGLEYTSELGIFNKYSETILKPGLNTVVISNIYGFRWSKIKNINRIKYAFGEKGAEARSCLYIANISVYTK